MKSLIPFIIFTLMVSIMNGQAVNPNGFSIYKGVNISHWLSQCTDELPLRDTFFTEMDVCFLKEAGFDHIRIPVDEIELWDVDGKKNQSAFNYLNEALSWCKRHELKVVVDLHTVRTHHFNAVNDGTKNTLFSDSDAQDRFIELWSDLSSELSKWDNDFLAYEILNEAVAEDHNDWNSLLAKTIAFLRRLEPDRSLIIGPNMWQQAANLKYLEIPKGDKNLIISFHDYTPFLVTHYKADWIAFSSYEGPVYYPGVSVSKEFVDQLEDEKLIETMKEFSYERFYDKSVLEENILLAISFSKEKGLPLYCGEWGCLPSPGREIRLNYYRDMVSNLNKHKIARANWDYKGSFRIVDAKTNRIDWDLIGILMDE